MLTLFGGSSPAAPKVSSVRTLFGGDIPGPQLSATSHEGASMLDKSLMKWNPGRYSADSDQLPEQGTLVSRSRDIVRNNGPAAGVIHTFRDHIAGPGLRLVATPDYRSLGKSKEWAEEWSTKAEALWRSWADSTYCDASEQLFWSGMTGNVLDSSFMNGEAIALPLWLPGTRSKWATRIALIEADRLSNPQDGSDTETLRGGVEIDRWDRAVAYWITKHHPGDSFNGFGSFSNDWERIPAETDWGRRRVLHVHAKERTGQTRGKPWFTPVLANFKRQDQFEKATLKSAVVNALVAAFISTPLDPTQVSQILGANVDGPEYQNWLANMRQSIAPLEGGAVVPLPPGTVPVEFNPHRVTAEFGQFIETIDANIASGLNIPYVLYKKDFARTNYSSARAALLEAYRHFRSRRKWLADYWATPCFGLVIEEAVGRGWIEAPDFYENYGSYVRCRWIGPARGWIDPVKEVEAAGLRMQYNLSTLEDECAEQGQDWEEVLQQKATERDRMISLGLDPEPYRERIEPQETEPEETAPKKKEPVGAEA